METKRRVLLVDDHPQLRSGIKEQLEEWGVDTTEASGGHEALRLLLEASAAGHPFQAVVSDVNMPEGDGVELLEDMVKRLPPAAYPVVYLHSGANDTFITDTNGVRRLLSVYIDSLPITASFHLKDNMWPDLQIFIEDLKSDS